MIDLLLEVAMAIGIVSLVVTLAAGLYAFVWAMSLFAMGVLAWLEERPDRGNWVLLGVLVPVALCVGAVLVFGEKV